MGMMWSLSDMRSETGHVRNFREMSGCFQNTLPPQKKNAEGWMMFLSKAFKLFQKMHEDAGISICVMETAVFFSGRGGGGGFLRIQGQFHGGQLHELFMRTPFYDIRAPTWVLGKWFHFTHWFISIFSERNMAQLAVIGWWGCSFRSRSLGVVVPPFMCVCSKISKQRTKTQSQNWQCQMTQNFETKLTLIHSENQLEIKNSNSKGRSSTKVQLFGSSCYNSWRSGYSFITCMISCDIFWRWGSCRSPAHLCWYPLVPISR